MTANELQTAKINNLLVIVPHQDDEVLMAGGLIYRLLRQNKCVSVCIATNGDCGCADFSKGQARLRESLRGLAVLGLDAKNVYFLGYADTGMAASESFLMRLYRSDDGQKKYASDASGFTYGLPEKADFHFQVFNEHGAYCKATLREDLRALLALVRPDTVLTTHKADRHGDHEALFYFVEEALREDSFARPRLLAALVHSPEGDETWPRRNSKTFNQPDGIQAFGLEWENRLVLHLPAELSGGAVQSNVKFRALQQYTTALEPNAVDFLLSFIKDEEIFWEIKEAE